MAQKKSNSNQKHTEQTRADEQIKAQVRRFLKILRGVW